MINQTFSELSANGNYYENELFTKFEDSFIMDMGSGRTGLKIIHGHRSMITFGAIKPKRCELSDVRFLFYSPKKCEARLLFLQFKKGERNRAGDLVFKVGAPQHELFATHPLVEYKKNGVVYTLDILKDKVHSCDDAGTMYVIAENIGNTYELSFANNKAIVGTGATDTYRCISTVLPRLITVPGFTYCEYVPDFKEFLRQVKQLQVGREILLGDLYVELGERLMKNAPEDLLGLVREYNNNRLVSDYNENVYMDVNTIFLNVDELEIE